MSGIKICGTGSYLPETIVDNEAFTAFVETSDEWISTRTGIRTRHIANGETTWRMGAIAARRALEASGIPAEKIGLIIVSSVSSDFATPSMACIIQHELGAVNAVSMDINAACTGFVYGVDMARRYLACGDIGYAIVIGTEMLSRLTNYEDRSTCVLFGDGAGACVLRADDTPYGVHLGSDGSGYGLMFSKHSLPASPFTKNPPEPDEIYARPEPVGYIVMGGSQIYKFATKMMPIAVEKACKQMNITPQQLDWIIPHQANIRIVQTAMKNLGLPMEKAYMTIDHTGNTSSATIPIALDEMAKAGKLKEGNLISLVGFGAGLTYGGLVFPW